MKHLIISALLAMFFIASSNAQDSDLVWQKDLWPDEIVSAKFTPDGNSIICATRNRIFVYETLTGASLLEIPDAPKIAKEIARFEFIPNTNQIIVAADKKFVIWDYNTGDTIRTLPGFILSDMAISKDGTHILTVQADDTINVIELIEGKIIKKLSAERGKNFGGDYIRYSQDNRFFVTGNFYLDAPHTRKDKVELWDGQTFKKITELGNLEGYMYDLDYSPDGKYVAACGSPDYGNDYPYQTDDGSIKIWDVETKKMYKTFYYKIGNVEYPVKQIKFSKDPKYIIYSFGDAGTPIKIFNYYNEKFLYSYKNSYGAFLDIDISNNNQFILAVGSQYLFLLNARWEPTFVIENNPIKFILYPNPTDQNVNINFTLQIPDYITIKINDSNGIEILNLFDDFLNPGEHQFNWNTLKIPSGVYYCTVSGKSINLIYKIIVIK